MSVFGWGRKPKGEGPDPYDRKMVMVLFLDGGAKEIATAQSARAEALVDEIQQALDTQLQQLARPLLFSRPGSVILRLDQVAAVWTIREPWY